jgi:ferredoxin-NADP reductase
MGMLQGTETGKLALLVRQIRLEAIGINSYELVDPEGRALPAAIAGSHIDIDLGEGLIRQYSLCNDPTDRSRYLIAVLQEAAGRGGSRRLHATLRVQDTVRTSLPRNNFRLDATAKRHLLIAGGIGITPIKAMVHVLAASGANFVLHYSARSVAHAAFLDELSAVGGVSRVHAHFDDAGPGGRLDVAALLRGYTEGTHLYHCGPTGLMAACAAAASHWPGSTVHSELFREPEPQRERAAAESSAGSFAVEITSTGARVVVPEGCSIADALNENGRALRALAGGDVSDTRYWLSVFGAAQSDGESPANVSALRGQAAAFVIAEALHRHAAFFAAPRRRAFSFRSKSDSRGIT